MQLHLGLRISAARAAAWALALVLLAAAPAASADGQDPPAGGGAPGAPGPDAPGPRGLDADPPKDPPKEPPPDPRKLPDEEKAKRLSDAERTWEEYRRNQDLLPVRTRRNAVNALGDLRYAPAAKFLRKVFDEDRDMTTRVAALVAIGKSGDAETTQYAVKKALSGPKSERVFALSLPRMYATVEDAVSRDWLASRLPQKDDDVTAAIVEAIGAARVESAVGDLYKLLEKSKDLSIRFECLRAVGRCGGTGAVSKLLAFLSHEDWRMRMGAAEGLGWTGAAEAIPELAKLITRDQEPIVVETAVEAIARLGTKDAIEPLIQSLRVARLRARQKARQALRGLAKSLYGHDKDYQVDPNSWTTWWNKVKRGVDPDDPSFAAKETASYFNFPIESDRVLFILDVSGSMNWPDAPRDSGIKPSDWKGRRIDVAHEQMFKVLRELAEQNKGRLPKRGKHDTGDPPVIPGENGEEPPTLFNVATFAGVVTPWSKEAVLASKDNVESAITWIEKQFPRGGTATFDAVQFGLEQPNIDTVYFLSDGVPSLGRFEERETILAEVRKLNRFRRITIHTIALIIGLSPIESARKYEDPDDMADIMSRLASENQGRFANESRD